MWRNIFLESCLLFALIFFEFSNSAKYVKKSSTKNRIKPPLTLEVPKIPLTTYVEKTEGLNKLRYLLYQILSIAR